jgi:translation initiation factor 3 subunit J
LRKSEKDSDLRHAEDLFGNLGISNDRSAGKHITLQQDPNDPTAAIDLSGLKLFDPNTKEQFATLRDTLVPLISQNAKKAQYAIFMQDFTKRICKDLPSDQIKKIASGLTTLSNEKMKEEKAAEKGGKKTKAAKTKTSLSAARDIAHRADTTAYDDLGE